jgi:hypothetical protein
MAGSQYRSDSRRSYPVYKCHNLGVSYEAMVVRCWKHDEQVARQKSSQSCNRGSYYSGDKIPIKCNRDYYGARLVRRR